MTAYYLGSKRWKPAVLENLVFLQRGFDITKAEQKDGDIQVISSSGPSSFHNEAMAEGPGVIIGRKGSLGTVHYSENDYWPHDTTLWSKSLKGNNPRFVYYALKCLGLERFNVGGANPTLNRNHIHGLPIYLADPTTQNKIEPPRVYRRAKLSENCPLWNRHQRRRPRSRIHPSSANARCGWRWNTAMSIRAKLRR